MDAKEQELIKARSAHAREWARGAREMAVLEREMEEADRQWDKADSKLQEYRKSKAQ